MHAILRVSNLEPVGWVSDGDGGGGGGAAEGRHTHTHSNLQYPCERSRRRPVGGESLLALDCTQTYSLCSISSLAVFFFWFVCVLFSSVLLMFVEHACTSAHVHAIALRPCESELVLRCGRALSLLDTYAV